MLEGAQQIEEIHESFRIVVAGLGDEAIRAVHERYETNPSPESNYQYHDADHSLTVASRTEQILRRIKENSPMGYVTERDILLGRLIALSHDRIINWHSEEMVDGDFTKVVMKREIGQNEEDSGDELIDSMRKVNEMYGEAIFTEGDESLTREAILATVPSFDIELMTVVQKNLHPDSHPVTIAIALSDIGSGALDPARFAKEGDALFREENLDVFRDLASGAEIPSDRKTYYAKRMLGWTNFQKGFLNGRARMFEKELGNLPGPAKIQLRTLFSHWKESQELVGQMVDRRTGMSFDELISDMGYFSDSRSHLLK